LVTDLVEVDVHALQLEIGGTVVAVRQSASRREVVRMGIGRQRTHQRRQGRARRRWSARRRHQLGYPVSCGQTRGSWGELELISGRHTHWPVWRWTCRRKTLA